MVDEVKRSETYKNAPFACLTMLQLIEPLSLAIHHPHYTYKNLGAQLIMQFKKSIFLSLALSGTIVSAAPFDCSGLPDGNYPNPVDCGSFYLCSNGNAYLFYCPGNLHFSVAADRCEFTEVAGCELL